MKSHAHFKNHPLHPALIVFPIAFLIGAALGDTAGRAGGWSTLWTVGGYLSVAGVIMGLLAGVPGFVDYLTIVPPGSSARRRATWHMLINVTALLLVAIGMPLRDWETFKPSFATLGLEIAAVCLIVAGGWLGATLVYRNQIGVDHRYAHAGKWHEQTIQGEPGQVVAVDGAAAMKVGQLRLLHWNGRRIAVARTEDGFAAFDDACTHRGGPLSDGALICGTVQCPWHGSQFDCRTGQVKAGPANDPISTYPAELRDGKVYLTLPAN